MSIYARLTEEFNNGRLRAVLSSGQAAVFHHVIMASKDGDWIIREDEETVGFILNLLEEKGAKYRFGAPLDTRWLAGGWSSHFEYLDKAGFRIRCDFVSRPPRIDPQRLESIWSQAEKSKGIPFVGAAELVDIKKTNREKDYAIIGDLARLLTSPDNVALYSRSARDLLKLAESHSDLIRKMSQIRPALSAVFSGLNELETALDKERRELMHDNENRLRVYMEALKPWKQRWTDIEKTVTGLPLREAHQLIVTAAESVLPFYVEEGPCQTTTFGMNF